jgi:xylulokinase
VDPTLAARTLAYDVTRRGYAAPPADLPEGIWSEVVPTGTSLGSIPADRAGRLGLRADTAFVVGGFDQAMATLGAGAIGPGVAHDGNGSWEALSLRVPGPVIDVRLRELHWSVGPSATDESSLELMTSWVGGSALRWLVGLASGGLASDAAVGRALGALPGVTRAVAIPELDAPMPPLGGGGAVADLDLGTGHADLVLAMVEGLAYRLRDAVAGLRSMGVEVTSLRATGGGARSDRWLQLKADATGLPVERPAVGEAGAFAAAVLAGSAVGVLPPAEAAIRELVRADRLFEPDASGRSRHVRKAVRQRMLSDALVRLAAS